MVLRDWGSARGAGQRVAARVVPRGLLSRLKIRVLLGSGDCPRRERLLEPQLSGWEIVASKPDTRAPKKPGASLAPGLSFLICGMKVKASQSCPTLCDPHGLYSTRNSPGQNTGVGRVAFPFSRGSSRPRNRTGVSCIAGGFFTN